MSKINDNERLALALCLAGAHLYLGAFDAIPKQSIGNVFSHNSKYCANQLAKEFEKLDAKFYVPITEFVDSEGLQSEQANNYHFVMEVFKKLATCNHEQVMAICEILKIELEVI